MRYKIFTREYYIHFFCYVLLCISLLQQIFFYKYCW